MQKQIGCNRELHKTSFTRDRCFLYEKKKIMNGNLVFFFISASILNKINKYKYSNESSCSLNIKDNTKWTNKTSHSSWFKTPLLFLNKGQPALTSSFSWLIYPGHWHSFAGNLSWLTTLSGPGPLSSRLAINRPSTEAKDNGRTKARNWKYATKL